MRHFRDKKSIAVSLVLFLLFLSTLFSCKDTGTTDKPALTEQCRVLLDNSDWDKAITACKKVTNSAGYHLTAQAYMGKAGFTMMDLMTKLSNATDDSGSTNALFGYVSGASFDKGSYRSAVIYLENALKGDPSNDHIYFEEFLLSSILVLRELKTLFGITSDGSSFSLCDPEATDDTKCDFTMDITNDSGWKFTASGLGSSFYTSICNGLSSTNNGVNLVHDASSHTINLPPSSSVAYDVTVDYCDIQADSILAYNKKAYTQHLLNIPNTMKDASGNSVLSALDFYSMFDSGLNFNVSSDELVICHADTISDVTKDNDRIYDCEILGSLLDPSSDSIFD